jgi:hypothetical protein
MKQLLRFWPYLLALALTLLILRPILADVWYPMHDSTHVARLHLMHETISRGEFPPLWAEGINQGLGYPLFHFYAPVFYYVSYTFSSLFGYFWGLKLALGLFIFFGILATQALVSRWGRGAMLLSAIFLATSPYLAVNLYVRGAFAEIAALCLFPLVLLVWQDLSTRRKQILAGATTAIFVMSHNLIPTLAFPLVAIYVLSTHYQNLKILLLPTLITLLLSATYLLPLFFERGFVQAEAVAKTSDYRLHFVEPWQIWNSTWGFGGSAPGVEDGFSFKMGKLHLVLALIGTGLLILKRHRYWLLSAFALYSLFMTTSLSSFVWESAPILALAQFSWRHLALAAPLLAVVASFSFTIINNKLFRLTCVLLTASCALILNLKYFVPQSTFLADTTQFTSDENLQTVHEIIPEYLPVWQADDLVLTQDYLTHENAQTIIKKAYYPTWQVKLDGRLVQTRPDSRGLLQIDNPQASDDIVLAQVKTPVQKIGILLTVLGFALSLYFLRRRRDL